MTFLLATQVLLIGLLVAAAITDAAWLRIPNIVVLAMLVVFGIHLALNWSALAVVSHLGSGLLILAAGMLLYSRGWWGAGDAKLAFASALWFPLERLPYWILATVLAGGVMTLVILAIRMALPAGQSASRPKLLQRKGPIPYGIAISIGTLIMIATGPIVQPKSSTALPLDNFNLAPQGR